MEKKTPTKTIRQSTKFNATPHEVYEALMDSEKHAAFTGEDASMSRKVGGKFNAYGKYITGKNVTLVKDKKIVQDWRSQEWPKGYHSKVTYELSRKGSYTILKFTHAGVPSDDYKDKSSGWKTHYWKPLKKYLEQK